MIRVEIQVDDRGRFSVGALAQPQRTQQPGRPASTSHLQPAADVDEALDIARTLLGGSQESADEASFGRGYRKAAPLPFTDATSEPDVQGRKYGEGR